MLYHFLALLSLLYFLAIPYLLSTLYHRKCQKRLQEDEQIAAKKASQFIGSSTSIYKWSCDFVDIHLECPTKSKASSQMVRGWMKYRNVDLNPAEASEIGHDRSAFERHDETSWHTAADWAYLLHPPSFARLASREPGRQMSKEFASVALPSILTLFAFWRVMGSTMQVSEQVIQAGEDISPCTAFTVELQMDNRAHAAYQKIHELCTGCLYKRSNKISIPAEVGGC